MATQEEIEQVRRIRGVIVSVESIVSDKGLFRHNTRKGKSIMELETISEFLELIIKHSNEKQERFDINKFVIGLEKYIKYFVFSPFISPSVTTPMIYIQAK